MGYGVWKIEIDGRKGSLVRVIIILLDICNHRNVCLFLSCSSFMFSLFDGSICSEYDVGNFGGNSYLFTTC